MAYLNGIQQDPTEFSLFYEKTPHPHERMISRKELFCLITDPKYIKYQIDISYWIGLICTVGEFLKYISKTLDNEKVDVKRKKELARFCILLPQLLPVNEKAYSQAMKALKLVYNKLQPDARQPIGLTYLRLHGQKREAQSRITFQPKLLAVDTIFKHLFSLTSLQLKAASGIQLTQFNGTLKIGIESNLELMAHDISSIQSRLFKDLDVFPVGEDKRRKYGIITTDISEYGNLLKFFVTFSLLSQTESSAIINLLFFFHRLKEILLQRRDYQSFSTVHNALHSNLALNSGSIYQSIFNEIFPEFVKINEDHNHLLDCAKNFPNLRKEFSKLEKNKTPFIPCLSFIGRDLDTFCDTESIYDEETKHINFDTLQKRGLIIKKIKSPTNEMQSPPLRTDFLQILQQTKEKISELFNLCVTQNKAEYNDVEDLEEQLFQISLSAKINTKEQIKKSA